MPAEGRGLLYVPRRKNERGLGRGRNAGLVRSRRRLERRREGLAGSKRGPKRRSRGLAKSVMHVGSQMPMMGVLSVPTSVRGGGCSQGEEPARGGKLEAGTRGCGRVGRLLCQRSRPGRSKRGLGAWQSQWMRLKEQVVTQPRPPLSP